LNPKWQNDDLGYDAIVDSQSDAGPASPQSGQSGTEVATGDRNGVRLSYHGN
jgi:hypothetical protein